MSDDIGVREMRALRQELLYYQKAATQLAQEKRDAWKLQQAAIPVLRKRIGELKQAALDAQAEAAEYREKFRQATIQMDELRRSHQDARRDWDRELMEITGANETEPNNQEERVNFDLNDERFHRKRIPWRTLRSEGVLPRDVMREAQKVGEFRIARSAREAWRRDEGKKNAR